MKWYIRAGWAVMGAGIWLSGMLFEKGNQIRKEGKFAEQVLLKGMEDAS